MRGRRPADTLTPAPPRKDVAPTPHAALDVAMATGGTQRGQSSTDHPQTSHLAASPVLTPWINSPSRNRLSLPVHATPNRARSTPSCRPGRPERASRSRAPRTRLAPLITLPCTTPHAQHVATPTLHRGAP
jgi:hypothetical protein